MSITHITKPCPGNFSKSQTKIPGNDVTYPPKNEKCPGHDETYTPKNKNNLKTIVSYCFEHVISLNFENFEEGLFKSKIKFFYIEKIIYIILSKNIHIDK